MPLYRESRDPVQHFPIVNILLVCVCAAAMLPTYHQGTFIPAQRCLSSSLPAAHAGFKLCCQPLPAPGGPEGYGVPRPCCMHRSK